MVKLIRMLRDRDQLESAVGYMEQFIEKYPDDDRADDMLYESGNVYEQMGLLDMAAYAYHNFIGTADVNDPRVPTAQQKLNDLGGNN